MVDLDDCQNSADNVVLMAGSWILRHNSNLIYEDKKCRKFVLRQVCESVHIYPHLIHRKMEE